MTFPHEEAQEPENIFSSVEPYTGEAPIPPLAAPSQVPMVRTQTQYTTAVAVQKPRNLDMIVTSVLNEAKYAKEAFYYSFPMGGKKVEGPSIGLAMAVARAWGNCAVPTEYYEQGGEWIFNAHFIDLETGFTVSRVFKKRVGKGLFKKLDDERAEDMTFQAAQSRAIRNVVTAGVPRWLLNQAIDAAKDAVLNGIKKEGVAHATELALKFLAGYGITPERVEAVLEKAVVDWVAEDLATLRGMASQLKDGQITAEQLFPLVAEKPKMAPKTEPKKDKPPVTTKDKEPKPRMDAQADPDKTEAEVSPPIAPPPGDQFTVGPPAPTANRIPTATEIWKVVVAKGVDLEEMGRYTGVSRQDQITPDNAFNVMAYVTQWTPKGKGGRKK